MDQVAHILSAGEYKKTWQVIHDRIFTEFDWDGKTFTDRKVLKDDWEGTAFTPFAQTQWEKFLFVGRLDYNETLFHAIAPLAKKLGDREFILFVYEVLEVLPAKLGWDYLALKETDVVKERVIYDCHLFGRSGQWGVYSCASEDFTCVGGESDFMNALALALGGRITIQKEFFESILWEEPRDAETAASIREQAFWQTLTKSVGWDLSEEKRQQP